MSVEQAEAEKELITFVKSYCSLISAHLLEVRETMASTTEAVMDGILKISDAKDDKKKMAEVVLLKRKDGKLDSDFQGDDDTFKNKQVGRQDTEKDQTSESAQSLIKSMDAFDRLDDRMQEILFTIIGALSTDDVVGQRIEHICEALDSLRGGLKDVLSPNPSCVNEKQVEEMKEKLLAGAVNSYTMPEEHAALESVFGPEMKKNKKAS